MNVVIPLLSARSGGGVTVGRLLIEQVSTAHHVVTALTSTGWTQGVASSRAKVIRVPFAEHAVVRILVEQLLLPLLLAVQRDVLLLYPADVGIWFRSRRVIVLSQNPNLYEDWTYDAGPQVTKRLKLLTQAAAVTQPKAHAVIAVSTDQAARIERFHFHRGKSVPVRPWLPVQHSSQRWIPDEADGLLFISDLYPYKNFELILSALQLLPRTSRPSIDVVGAPIDLRYFEKLRSTATDLGVSESVRWLGRLEHEDTLRLMRRATALLMPSRRESLGLPLLEAMAVGLPIVATNLASFHEIVGPRLADCLLPVDAPKLWAEEVSRLTRDSSYAEARSRQALTRHRELCDLPTIVSALGLHDRETTETTGRL